jgi:hypothetical protein
LGGASRLRPLYQLTLAQELGEWRQAGELMRQLQLNPNEVAEVYWQGVQWARQVTGE